MSTQLEKARHEARCKAAQKNLEEVQKTRAREKERADSETSRLEVELQRVKNQLAVAQSKVDTADRAAEDPARVDVKLQDPPVKQPCNCVVS